MGAPGFQSGRGSRKVAAPLTIFYSSFQQLERTAGGAARRARGERNEPRDSKAKRGGNSKSPNAEGRRLLRFCWPRIDLSKDHL